MPKLLVLFDPHSDEMTRLADAVADGVRSVRFAEVDVRRIGAAAGDAGAAARHRALESADALAAYDGIIVGASSVRASTLDVLDGTRSLVDKVGSVFTATPAGSARREVLWSVLGPMGDRGMILVPPVADTLSEALESAREQGKRVANVVGWVAHARSHHHHH